MINTTIRGIIPDWRNPPLHDREGTITTAKGAAGVTVISVALLLFACFFLGQSSHQGAALLVGILIPPTTWCIGAYDELRRNQTRISTPLRVQCVASIFYLVAIGTMCVNYWRQGR